MKSSRIAALVLSFHLALLTSLAQQSTSDQVPVATATSPPLTVTEQIQRAAGFLTVTYQDGPTTKGVIGTYFFVWVLDKRIGENQGFMYLVTNRHAAQPGIDRGAAYPTLGVSLRLNLIASQGEIQSFQGQIPLGNQRKALLYRRQAEDHRIRLSTILPCKKTPQGRSKIQDLFHGRWCLTQLRGGRMS